MCSVTAAVIHLSSKTALSCSGLWQILSLTWEHWIHGRKMYPKMDTIGQQRHTFTSCQYSVANLLTPCVLEVKIILKKKQRTQINPMRTLKEHIKRYTYNNLTSELNQELILFFR